MKALDELLHSALTYERTPTLRATGASGPPRRSISERPWPWPRRGRRRVTSWARRSFTLATGAARSNSSRRPCGCRRLLPTPLQPRRDARRDWPASAGDRVLLGRRRSEPAYVDARLGLADALRRSGQLGRIAVGVRAILRIDPGVVKARFGYAAALIRLNRYQKPAIGWPRRWISIRTRCAFARAAARLFAAAPDDRVRDGRRALAIAQMLVSRQPRTIELAETMAMASAESGAVQRRGGVAARSHRSRGARGRRDSSSA